MKINTLRKITWLFIFSVFSSIIYLVLFIFFLLWWCRLRIVSQCILYVTLPRVFILPIVQDMHPEANSKIQSRNITFFLKNFQWMPSCIMWTRQLLHCMRNIPFKPKRDHYLYKEFFLNVILYLRMPERKRWNCKNRWIENILKEIFLLVTDSTDFAKRVSRCVYLEPHIFFLDKFTSL